MAYRHTVSILRKLNASFKTSFFNRVQFLNKTKTKKKNSTKAKRPQDV